MEKWIPKLGQKLGQKLGLQKGGRGGENRVNRGCRRAYWCSFRVLPTGALLAGQPVCGELDGAPSARGQTRLMSPSWCRGSTRPATLHPRLH
eukprot:155972-Chlamydomonas_euryale.AAC.3